MTSSVDRECTVPQQFQFGSSISSMPRQEADDNADASKPRAVVFRAHPGNIKSFILETIIPLIFEG